MKRLTVATLALCMVLCACTADEPEIPDSHEPSATPDATSPVVPDASPDTPSPAAPESGGDDDKTVAVYTDWSRLGEREKPLPEVGTRMYEEYTDRLIPSDDYGMLIPYAGLRLMDNWPALDGCMYGLMTLEGAVVTDPVYSRVYRPGGYDDGGKPYTLPLLVLKKGEKTGIENQNPDRYAVAAADGRWCTPFDYLAVLSSGYGLILVTADSLTVMTPEGDIEKTWTVPEIGIAQSEFDSMLSEIYWGDGGYSGMRRGDYLALGWEPDSDYTKIRCFDLINGGITVMFYEEWESLTVYPDWSQEENTAVPGAELKKDDMLGPDAPGLLSLTEYTDTDVTVTHYLEDGTPLPQFTLYGMKWYQRVAMVGGLIEVLDWNTASYYEADTLECRFRTYLNYEGD